jgi:hypothetical protein
MNSKINDAINLLNQIIEKNLYEDYKSHKGEKPGVDWNVFHLQVLLNLLLEIKNGR